MGFTVQTEGLVQEVLMKLVQEHKPSVEMEQTTYHALAEARLAADKAKFVQYRLKEAIESLQSIPSAASQEQQ